MLEECAKSFDSQSYAYYLRGFLLFKKNDFDEALKNFTKLKEYYDTQEISHLILTCFAKKNAWEEIINYYAVQKKELFNKNSKLIIGKNYFKKI